jgi:uncharacterized membrane protein YozB (DUF420 family)
MIIQIAVLILLLCAIWLKRTKKFRQHGITMLAAVVLHTVTILAWMIPSFSSLFSPSTSISLADVLTVAIIVHAFTGIAAAILGIWIVASWRLKTDMKSCFAKKSAMRVTITMWLIALAIGIILYVKIIQLF